MSPTRQTELAIEVSIRKNWTKKGGTTVRNRPLEGRIFYFKGGDMRIFKKNRIIGILGGMGPEATAKLYDLLIKIAQEEYQALSNDSFPEIIIYSVPVPDFISSLKSKEIAERMLISRIKMLSNMPISFFCIGSNTAHLLIDDLRKSTRIPFVSLIEETANEVKGLKIKKVGLLASPVAIKTGIYQKVLEKQGVEIILLQEKEIQKLGRIIKETVAGKKNGENTLALEKIAKNLVLRGAEAIVLGCTELPLLFPKKFQAPVLDTLEILAKACLEKYYDRMKAGEKNG